MKKLLLLSIFALPALAAFSQAGSQAVSGIKFRVLDSAAYRTAATVAHTQGYADMYFNAQATTPHFDIWNGVSYTHVFDFNSGTGSSFTLTSGNGTTANGTAVDLGGAATANTTFTGNFNWTWNSSGSRMGNFRVWSNGTVGLDGSTTSFLQTGTNVISTTTSGVAVVTTGPLLLNTDAGTSGQLLTSNGSGSAPTWEDPTGGGGTVTTRNNLPPSVHTSSFTLAPADTSRLMVLDNIADLVITLDDFSAVDKGLQFVFYRKAGTDTVYFDDGGEVLEYSTIGIGQEGIAWLYYNPTDNEFYLPGGGSGSGGGGSGISDMDVVSANGFAGTVANPTTSPDITISTTITGIPKGDGTAFTPAVAGTDYTTPSSTETQTNKSISLATNTVTGTTAQFNTALSDNDFATLAGTETLTNKTLTNAVVGTQSAGNNSTTAASTAYADAKVADAINNGTTAIAPSQNSVFDALALKLDNIMGFTTDATTARTMTDSDINKITRFTNAGAITVTLNSTPTAGKAMTLYKVVGSGDITFTGYSSLEGMDNQMLTDGGYVTIIHQGGNVWSGMGALGAGGGGGGGSVSSVSVVNANGFNGSVANATTTPAITISTTATGILKGNGTAISAATAGTDYTTPSSTETVTNKSISGLTNTITDITTSGTAWQLTGTSTLSSPILSGSYSRFRNDNIGGAFTTNSGIRLENTTASTLGAPQSPGVMTFGGFAHKTSATAESRPIEMRIGMEATQSTLNPIGLFQIEASVNGGTWSDVFLVNSSGSVNMYGPLVIAHNTGSGQNVIEARGNSVSQFTVDQEGLVTIRQTTGGIRIKEGTNASMGIATLVGGTVTVNTTKVTTSSRIMLTHQNTSGTPGFVIVSARSAGTSFTILSGSGTDTSDIAWMIIEPAP